MKEINGTPVEKGVRARIVRLLQHHEAAAAALRTTLELVDGEAAQAKARKPPYNIINQALAIDATRRKGKRKQPTTKEERLRQRQRTVAILDKYDRVTPRPIEIAGRSMGILVQHGYLVRKGDGYVRTVKTYTP